MITANSLNQLLQSVCDQFLQESKNRPPEKFEEEGGFVLQRGEEFGFERVRNSNTGTPIAVALYTADRDEFAGKVCGAICEKWGCLASFHTHPPGCGPMPSREDLTKLFKSFPTNFIFSPDMALLVRYDYKKEDNSWLAQEVKIHSPN